MRNDHPTRRDFLATIGHAGLAAFAGAIPLGGCESLLEAIRRRPTRRDLATLASGDPTIATYRAAVAAMKALPASDPRNWNAQAEIHFNFCPHGNWYFLPWHRAYLLYFEQICRELTGVSDFALPYWNWTCNRTVPAPFLGDASNALFHPGRVASPPAALGDGSVGPDVIDAILDETNFLVFASSPAAGQRDNTGYGPLEGNPHNSVHGFIGGSMGGYRSPRDPIFWMHHNMIERIWWDWNVVRGHANTNDAAWVNFAFNGNFVDRTGTSVNTTVGVMNLAPLLAYQFDDSPITSCGIRGFTRVEIDRAALRKLLEEGAPAQLRPLRTFGGAGAMEVRVGGAASRALKVRDPALAAGAPLGDARVLVRVLDVRQPRTGDWFVRVFVNLPTASAATPITDPHYAGSFAFFNDPDAHAGHTGAHGAAQGTFLVDATRTLQRLRGLDQLRSSGEVTVSLVPVRMFEGPPQQPVLTLGGLELQLAQSTAAAPKPYGTAKEPARK